MEHSKQGRWYSFVQPFTWLFYYFLQTDRFMDGFELKDSTKRLQVLLKLVLPLFLVSYLLAMAIVLLSSFFSPNLISILLATAVGTILGIVVGISWDILAGIPIAIIGSIWIGMWMGMWMGFSWNLGTGVLISTIGGLLLGTVGGVRKFSVKDIEELEKYLTRLEKDLEKKPKMRAAVGVWAEFIGNSVLGFVGGFGQGIEEHKGRRFGKNILIGVVTSIFVGIALSVGINIVSGPDYTSANVFLAIFGITAGAMGGITVSLVEGIGVDMAVGIGGGIAIGAMISFVLPYIIYVHTNLLLSVLAIAPIAVVSIAWSIGMSIGVRCAGGRIKGNKLTFVTGIFAGIFVGITAGILANVPAIFVFILCYILSYAQLPLYPASALSSRRAYKACQKDPSQVFTYLRCSSLHWDEHVSLPLPFLKNIMQIAAKQDVEQTLSEIAFIAAERPHQIKAGQAGLLEIIIHSLEMREQDLKVRRILRDIAEAFEHLDIFLQQGENVLSSRWAAQLEHVKDASLDVNRFRSSFGWQVRHDAMENLIINLQHAQVYKLPADPTTQSEKTLDKEFDRRLNEVIERWLSIAQYELEKLNQEPQKSNQVYNPYIAGPVLDEPGISLFVGRSDLAQLLDQALRRGSHRPTFFLHGERRMGKSSTLKQLPHLLDARYFLPVFYDLQSPEITSSISAFLGTVAEKIYEVMNKKGMLIEKLEKEPLQEASLKNEAAVYYPFNEWLKSVEHVLEQNDRTLLLTFDEFENLEKAGQAKYVDLHLLLSWFRSIIQNRPRLALLFSGGRTVGEMGIEMGMNWSGYFVNVQTLWVKFLRQAEAFQLITQPVPDYPIERIFGGGVVDEIIRVTNCHPFLVQAICSNLIDNLNADNRNRAEIQDVVVAVDQVLDVWWDGYFQDLWNRTDHEQRNCLIALNKLGKSNLQQIAQQSNLNKGVARDTLPTVRHTLQNLIRRDLVLQEYDSYQIAAPIFSKWVERNC
jgi:uncharacterized protein